jgi:cardiolipin synthase
MATLAQDDWRPARVQPGHRLLLLQGGNALFPALVAAMDAATQSVHLETYIFEFAGSALQVAEALERAARRGVHVRLVVDGIGTPHVPPEWQQRLAEAGVYWRVYAPLGRFGLALPSSWRRLHRKLCVVDGSVGFCGGINIIDDLDDVALGRLTYPRLDFSLQVSGPLVADMTETMERLWWRLQAVRKARQREFRAAWLALRAGRPAGDFSGLFEPHAKAGPHAGNAALVLRDNVRHRHDIERSYLKAIGEAHHEVLIANAYFIPGRKLRRALTMAAARGVRVRLLLQGKYEHFMQYHAARPVFHQLLRAGVEIYEYLPSALHAKVAVVDRRWATVGSTNLDPLSLLLAREANVVSADEGFALALHERLDHIVTHDGRALQPQALAARPWPQRALDRLAFMVMRATLFVTGHRY